MHPSLRYFRMRGLVINTVNRSTVFLLIAVSFLLSSDLFAVRNRFYEDEQAVHIKEVRDSVDDIRHEVNNHEAEIRTFDEKLKNLELIIEGVRDQLSETVQAQKEQFKGHSTTLENKICALDTLSKSLISDLRQFKMHANETSSALVQYKQKIGDLEAVTQQQTQNIDHLQGALRTLMEALQVKDSSAAKISLPTTESTVANSYRIKSGDSLEKIARMHQTSVSTLKELNGLSHDRIIVGQLLKIPEK